MPYMKVTKYRYYCPLGEECGRGCSYIGDAPSTEEARSRLVQHLSSQPNHAANPDLTDEDKQELCRNAHIEEIEKDVWVASPLRGGGKKGSKGGGKSSSSQQGRDGRSRSRRRDRSPDGSRRRSRSRGRSRSRHSQRSLRVDSVVDVQASENALALASATNTVTMSRKALDEVLELAQLAEQNCLDSARLCSQASTAFSSQATAFNKLRQGLVKALRDQV